MPNPPSQPTRKETRAAEGQVVRSMIVDWSSRNRIGHTLLLSVLSANICAATFVGVLYYRLPPTDGAYGQGFVLTMLDPFVLSLAVPVATVIGCALTPVAMVCLRGRHLLRCGLLVLGMTIAELVAVGSISLWYAFWASPLVTVASLMLCRMLDVRWLQT